MVMPTNKLSKNAISSIKEFKTLYIKTVKELGGFRVSDRAIRHLRLAMVLSVSTTGLLLEALWVIFTSLVEKKKRRISLDNVRAWLQPESSTVGEDEDTGGSDSDEQEWSTDANLEGESLHYVRKILDSKRENHKTYYLVDWKSIFEHRKDLL